MNPLHPSRAIVIACALATPAIAQVKEIAFDISTSEDRGSAPIDAGIAVSPSRIVLSSNQNLQLWDKAGAMIVQKDVECSGGPCATFPFRHEPRWRGGRLRLRAVPG